MSDDTEVLTLTAEERDNPVVLRRKLRGALTRIETLERDLEVSASVNTSLATAYADILRAMRDKDGTCRICGAALGEQHRQPCVAWPAIVLRHREGA